jgi:hypothetical protein
MAEEYEVHRLANHPPGAKMIGRYKNKTFARNKVDKLDSEYGAVAHRVKTVQALPSEHEHPYWSGRDHS